MGPHLTIKKYILSQRGRRVGGPVKSCRQQTIRNDSLLFTAEAIESHLVTLLPVAGEVGQLQVGYVGGVATFIDRDDMVYRRTEGVGIFQTEVHRLPADPADRLRGIDPLLILFKLCPVLAVLVWSVTCCHKFTNTKAPVISRRLCRKEL